MCKKRGFKRKIPFYSIKKQPLLRFLHIFSYKMEKLKGIIIIKGAKARFLHSSRLLTTRPHTSRMLTPRVHKLFQYLKCQSRSISFNLVQSRYFSFNLVISRSISLFLVQSRYFSRLLKFCKLRTRKLRTRKLQGRQIQELEFGALLRFFTLCSRQLLSAALCSRQLLSAALYSRQLLSASIFYQTHSPLLADLIRIRPSSAVKKRVRP
jgi:hypothetical protein